MESACGSRKRRCISTDNDERILVSLPNDFQNTVGKIIKVSLLNFLNYAHLTFHCSPNLNLIFGRNGKGKSAIVQGIALCFGGTGRSVGRDTVSNHYIKDYHLHNGPSYANIEVCLSNHGPNSYEPNVYGDVIVLSRKICRNGSYFFIGGSLLKKSPVTRKELGRYLRHIKMDISNPTTYMDQELCKSFFFRSSPEDFYKYYSAAAGLDRMEENINSEKKNLEDCKAELKVRRRVLIPDRENLETLSKQITVFEEKLKEWKSAKEMYKLSLYKVEKDNYTTAKEKYDKFRESDPQQEIIKLKESIGSLTEEETSIKSEIQTLVDESVGLKKNIEEISDSLSALDEDINEIKSSVESKKICISRIQMNFDKFIEVEPLPGLESNVSEKHRLELELKMCSRQYEEANVQHKNVMSQITEFESKIRDIEQQIRDARTDMENQKRENANLRLRGRDNPSETKRRLLYRYDLSRVREKIAKMKSSTLFFHDPIGPIGEYIKVIPKVPNWKVLPILERHLKRIMLVWLVATESDRKALEKILISEGCDANSVKIMKTNLFYRSTDIKSRIEAELCRSNFQSVLYMFMAIEEMPGILLDILLESFNISKTAVCKDEQEMFEVLNNNALNVTAAYTLSNIDFGKRINGSLFFSPSDDKDPFTYRYVRYSDERESTYAEEISDQLNKGKEHETVLSSLVKNLTSNLRETKKRLTEARRKVDQIKADRTNILKRRAQTEYDLNKESAAFESTEIAIKETSGPLESANEFHGKQLEELNKQTNELENQLEFMLKNKKDKEVLLEGTQNNLNGTMKKISETRLRYQKMKTRMSWNKSRIKNLEKKLKEYNASLSKYSKAVEDSQRLIRKHEEDLKRDGIDFSGDLPPKRPSEYLQIVNLNKGFLQNAANDSKSVEQHLQSLKEKQAIAEESIRTKEKKLLETSKNYAHQKRNYISRCNRLEEFKGRIESLAKKAFNRTLYAVMGYDGSLVFNEVNRTLEIQIHNKQQSYSKAHVATDVKTLSGGEQSSIQFSMLQSLASVSFSPVHIFDEIDVYMDESTRMKNIDALVNFAAKNKNRQLFLVTPHSEFAKHIAETYPGISRLFNVSQENSQEK